MLETRLLRRVIHYIWECYRDRGEIRIRLRNDKGDELHVEEDGEESKVAVRYYAKQKTGELVKQMEVVCFIQHYGEWVPLELYKDGSTTIYGTGDAETGDAEIVDYRGQWQAVGYCDAWALRLLEEGFLALAAKLNPLGKKPTQRPNWPEPTISAPDLEEIENWIWDDGGCQATDGCWTEIDGVCPHGHPSWWLRLRLA